jgi:hypothetical protein
MEKVRLNVTQGRRGQATLPNLQFGAALMEKRSWNVLKDNGVFK